MGPEKIDGQLLLYIQIQLWAGVDRQTLVNRLSKAKWTDHEINIALSAYDSGERAKFPFLLILCKLLGGFFHLLHLLIIVVAILLFVYFAIDYIEHAADRNNRGEGDRSIMQSLGNARSVAQLSYDKNGYVYSGVCGSDGFEQDENIIQLIKAAESNAKGEEKVVCNSDAESFAISARLSSKNTRYWCVDSQGNMGTFLRPLSLEELECPVNEFQRY